jgi:hypothetical protein
MDRKSNSGSVLAISVRSVLASGQRSASPSEKWLWVSL